MHGRARPAASNPTSRTSNLNRTGLAIVSLLAFICLLLVAAADSWSARVSEHTTFGTPGKTPDVSTTLLETGPTETSQLAVDLSARTWAFSDPNNAFEINNTFLSPGSGYPNYGTVNVGACQGAGDSRAACRPSDQLAVLLGGRSDRAVIAGTLPTSWILYVNGGGGDDEVQVPAATTSKSITTMAVFNGGPGSDRFAGTAGADFMQDSDGGSTRDVYDGGPGSDIVNYGALPDLGFESNAPRSQQDTTAVRVSLAKRAANEDALSSIESVAGGSGDDVLTGDARRNELVGGKGDDRLLGGPGDDVLGGAAASFNPDRFLDEAGNDSLLGGSGKDRLLGGLGADLLRGGAGNDSLDAGADRRRDRLACGSGSDTVRGTSLRDSVGSDCERVVLESVTVAGRPKRSGGNVIFMVRPDYRTDRLVLRSAGGKRLGRGRRITRRGAYRVRLSRLGQRLARRGRTIIVQSVAVKRSKGESEQDGYRIRLR